MGFRNVNTSNLTFKYPVTWEKEKADTYKPYCSVHTPEPGSRASGFR